MFIIECPTKYYHERESVILSIEELQRMTKVLAVTIGELVYGKENISDKINTDPELVNLFKKTQFLNLKEKETVKDLLSAFILKADLKQRLSL